jgi:hypothetical protein
MSTSILTVRFFAPLRPEFVMVLALTGALHARSAQIRSPGGVGNSDSLIPFGLEQQGIPSARYQQVYNASDFSSLAAGGGFITELRFRSDPVSGRPFTAGLLDIQINLSTTLRAADGLSLVFADNIGTDDTVVYGRGPLTISGSPGLGFDVRITLATPFLYEPVVGNLLLDVRNFRAGSTFDPVLTAGPFDASNVSGDSVSHVLAPDVTASQATSGNSLGLETLFIVTPIPEPSSLALLLCGCIAVVVFTHGRKKK